MITRHLQDAIYAALGPGQINDLLLTHYQQKSVPISINYALEVNR